MKGRVIQKIASSIIWTKKKKIRRSKVKTIPRQIFMTHAAVVVVVVIVVAVVVFLIFQGTFFDDQSEQRRRQSKKKLLRTRFLFRSN